MANTGLAPFRSACIHHITHWARCQALCLWNKKMKRQNSCHQSPIVKEGTNHLLFQKIVTRISALEQQGFWSQADLFPNSDNYIT